MRILQLHNEQRGTGGADEVIADERQLLLDAGHSVDQLILPSAQRLDLRMALAPVYNRAFCGVLRSRIAATRPDIVHVHTPFPVMSPAVFSTASRAGAATVGTLHSYRYSCIAGTLYRSGKPCELCVGHAFKIGGVQHRCYHDSLPLSGALTLGIAAHRAIGTLTRRVDRYIALTSYAREMAIRDGLPANRIIVKPNSVRDPLQSSGTAELREPYVLFAARLLPEKGVRAMLAAWRPGGDELPRLVIAGDGALRSEVEAAAALPGSRIDFRGWLTASEVELLLVNARAALIPSEWPEGGQPRTQIGAFAAGIPCIVADVPNLSTAVQDENVGVVFRRGDAASLREQVLCLLGDETRSAAMATRARSYYERVHSPAANLSALVAIYEQAIVQHRAVRSSS